jgi:hypothetical protein
MPRNTNWRPLIGTLVGIGAGIALGVGTGNPGAGIGVGAGLAIIFGGGALMMDRKTPSD